MLWSCVYWTFHRAKNCTRVIPTAPPRNQLFLLLLFPWALSFTVRLVPTLSIRQLWKVSTPSFHNQKAGLGLKPRLSQSLEAQNYIPVWYLWKSFMLFSTEKAVIARRGTPHPILITHVNARVYLHFVICGCLVWGLEYNYPFRTWWDFPEANREPGPVSVMMVGTYKVLQALSLVIPSRTSVRMSH